MSTWSISRDQTLHLCERKYYFQYLVTARTNSRDTFLREVAFLKKLSNLAAWKGSVFHSEVAIFLEHVRVGEVVNYARIEEIIRDRMKTEWDFSFSRSYLNNVRAIDEPGGLALFEHEYLQDQSINLESQITDVLHWFRNFLKWSETNDLVKQIRAAKDVWIEPQLFGSNAPGFQLQDVQVITKVDLAIRNPNGEFIIFDWKTGKPTRVINDELMDVDIQVNVYLLWPYLTLQVPMEKIKGNLVYLGEEPFHRTYSIDSDSSEKTLSLARMSIARSKDFEGMYKEKSLTIDDLDFARHSWMCKWCNFKRLCWSSINYAPNS